MKSWPVQDAKARLSEFLQASLKHGPQMVPCCAVGLRSHTARPITTSRMH